MELAGGTISSLLVGLRVVLEQYAPVHAAPASLPTSPTAAAMRIAFPLVTPHGIAALIVLLANSHEAARTASILAILIGVMVLNLLALLFVRRIMAGDDHRAADPRRRPGRAAGRARE
jgi:multiple antibiotic resistance protein